MTFKVPKRYVGESSGPVQPVRLGVNGGLRRRKKKKEEDDTTYGANGRGRTGRRDWKVGVEEEVAEDEDGEEDEIVD